MFRDKETLFTVLHVRDLYFIFSVANNFVGSKNNSAEKSILLSF